MFFGRQQDMPAGVFSFKPAEIPKASRGRRGSKYAVTVEAIYKYLTEHPDQRSVKIELGGVGIKSAVASFRSAISRLYPEKLRLVQRAGDLYIERR
jgi:hypothetical protein